MDNDKRKKRLELSLKLMKMGNALINEGLNEGDENVTTIGNIMTLCGGLVLDDKGCVEFNNLCMMFTAKTVLEDITKNGSKFPPNLDIDSLIKRMNDGLSDKNKGDYEND